MSTSTTTPGRWDRATVAGMAAPALAAAVLSFSALAGLARLAGVTGTAGAFRLAWLLPIAIDAYAVTATRVWLRTATSDRTRLYARRNAIGAIALSVAGNAAFHGLSAAGVHRLTGGGFAWLLVVAVSAVPPVILGLVGHLHALICADHTAHSEPAPTPVATAAPVTVEPPSSTTRPAVSRTTSGRSRPTGTGPNTAKRTGNTSTGNGTPSGRGDAEAVMRRHWQTERAAGRTPTGAELDRIAGTRDYGRKVRRALLAEETTAEPAPHATEPDAAEAAA